MKTVKTLLTLFLCSFVLMGCNDEENEFAEIKFTIDETEITIGHEGGAAKVTYQLSEKVNEEFKITAPEWIYSFVTTTPNEISFQVAANTAVEKREETIAVEYHGIRQNVVVTQEGKPEEPQEPEKPEQQEKFLIDLSAEELTITMNVTPSDNEIFYMYDIVNEGIVKNDFQGNFNRFLEQVIDEMIFLYTDMQGMTTEEAVRKITSQGASSYTFNKIQKANTTFIGYAVELNLQGEIVGETFTEKITTRPTTPSDNEIEIEVSDITHNQATLTFTTSNDDPWLYIVEPTENWEGKSDDEIMKTMCDIFSLSELATTGNCTTPVTDMEPETNYTVFAFGFQEGTYNTALYRANFTTTAYTPVEPETGKYTFTFNFYEITNSYIKAGISCDPEGTLFYWDICKGDKTAAQVQSALEKQAKQQMADYGINSLAQYYQFMANNPNPYKYSGLKADSEYKLYAVAIDPGTGEFISDFIFSETVRTEK